MNKIIALLCISILLVGLLTSCSERENQSAVSGNNTPAISVPESSSQLDNTETSQPVPQEFRFSARDGYTIRFNGIDWIDDTRIIVCETNGSGTSFVSIVGVEDGQKLFDHSWTTPPEHIPAFSYEDDVAVVINGPHTLRIDCKDYSFTESTAKVFDFGARLASSGWLANPRDIGSPVELIAPGKSSGTPILSADYLPYVLIEYGNWSPNGEYLLVYPLEDNWDTIGPSTLYTGEYVLISTEGEALCSFEMELGEGRNPVVMWTDANTLLVYRVNTEAKETTVQEYFPASKSSSEEMLIDRGGDAVLPHGGTSVSLVHEKNDVNRTSIVVFWRNTGDISHLTVPHGSRLLRLSPNDKFLMVEDRTFISIITL